MSKRIEWIIRETRGPRVLNVGCTDHILDPASPYWLHGRLAQEDFDLAGIDINEDLVDKMKAAGFADTHVMSAETFSLPVKFNTIVAGELIEHLANPAAFLQRVREHLTEEGRLVLSTPYAFGVMHWLSAMARFPRTCPFPQHVSWFCPSTLRALFERCGFHVETLVLVEDYVCDPAFLRDKSLAIKLFAAWMWIFRWLLPRRVSANSMVCVAVPQVSS